MNALVKKEIRLLLPAWIVAGLLAMVQAITRPYDFYVASMLFFGLTIMALSSIGRETTLNTFSSLLAQPAERIRIWQVKLTVLAVAFVIVFVVWLAAFGIAFVTSHVDESDRESSYNLFITVCLIATATFTGGLWTTLLLRQVAGAFWLTLLVPATLSGFSAVFFAGSDSENLVIAVLSVVIGIYSIAGFFFARRLYFRAQDVGWSGGVIALPEWKFSSRAKAGLGSRARKPLLALVKKEFSLQQGALTGAVGLLVMHVGIVLLRTFHHFEKNSPGEAVTMIFWMLWLVLPVIVGCIAVAEERKAGVMESQLCLPASRRVQFIIKALVALPLGIFLGGVMPVLVEGIGVALGSKNLVISELGNGAPQLLLILMGFAAWLSVVSFFASSLAKNFLQAAGFGVATFFGCMMMFPVFTGGLFGLEHVSPRTALATIITIPTLFVTLLWLAWLNFKNFREGWPAGRRILYGIITALLFIFVSSHVLYNRDWEALEPAEPAHGPAKLSLANPPILQFQDIGDGLTVQLPDGRVWFDRIGDGSSFHEAVWKIFNPLPGSIGPQRFVSGTNWVQCDIYNFWNGDKTDPLVWYNIIGIKSDGTLWVSDFSHSPIWSGDRMIKFGEETNWQALSSLSHIPAVMLLKKDGSLWTLGTNQWSNPEQQFQTGIFRNLSPYRVGTNSDWAKISRDNDLVQKTDGSRWVVGINSKNGKAVTFSNTNWDNVDLDKIPPFPPVSQLTAYVRKDGTLWFSALWRGRDAKVTPEIYQIGNDTNWVTASAEWMGSVVALKSDGTLWQRDGFNTRNALLMPLGIHDDWVAMTETQFGTVSLAADGSLWLWPHRMYTQQELLMRPPKQPQFLGNVFNAAD